MITFRNLIQSFFSLPYLHREILSFISKLKMMSFFFKKSLIYAGILYLVLFLIKCTVSYAWGGILLGSHFQLDQKVQYLKEACSENKYNTLALGSSAINHHFNPDFFDTISNEKSFNVGMNGMFFIENSYILENIINDKSIANSIKQIIFEVKAPALYQANRHSIRSKYILDIQRTKFALNYYKNFSRVRNIYAFSFLENLLLIGEIKKIIEYHVADQKLHPSVIAEHGFSESAWGGMSKKDHRGINYTSPKKVNITHQDEVLSQELLRLWTICKSKNIDLYFLYPPNDQIHLKFKHKNNIYMGDGVDVPTLFQAKNRDKVGNHLNRQGAKFFSIRLATLYNKIKNGSANQEIIKTVEMKL